MNDFLLKKFLLQLKSRSFFYFTAGGFFIGAFAGLLFLTTTYTSEAYFKYMGTSSEKAQESFAAMILGEEANGKASSATSLFTSRKLMDAVVKKEGLQVSYKEEGGFPFFKKVWDQCRHAVQVYKKSVLLEKMPPSLSFSNVEYKGQEPFSFRLKIDDQNRLFLLEEGKEKVLGEVGKPFSVGQATMVVYRSGEPQNKVYLCQVSPLSLVSKDWLQPLSAKTDQEDDSIVHLQLKTEGRFLGARILNGLMEAYRKDVEQESREIAQLQINYLQKRQQELLEGQRELLEAHAQTISQEMQESSFVNAHTQMEWLLKQYTAIKERLSQLKLEKEQLTAALQSGYYEFSSSLSEPLSFLTQAQQQRDLLQLSLGEELGGEFAFKKEDSGLTLETSRDLYAHFCKVHAELEVDLQKRHYLSKRVLDPHFELSSLETVLQDQTSHHSIREAGTIALALQDEKNHSEKERERLRAQLQQQRLFLREHLLNSAHLLALQQQEIEKNKKEIQQTMVGLLDKQISFAQKKIEKSIEERLAGITQEEHQLRQHIGALNAELSNQPYKWMQEEIIAQNRDLNRVVIEEITRLVETKNVAHHLEVLRSAPLLAAEAPLKPNFPLFLLWACIGGLLSGTGYLLYIAAKQNKLLN